MGNQESKTNFRKAVIDLTTSKKSVEPGDTNYWEQFWSASNVSSAQDVFSLILVSEIRILREDAPNNLATLCYKTVERLVQACEHSCTQPDEAKIVINCVRILTRLLPIIFEDTDWRGYFWSALPADRPIVSDANSQVNVNDEPLAVTMLNSLCDLLFCPDFTVASATKRAAETVESLSNLDSCEYIWEAGVGFAHSPPYYAIYDANRAEILKLLLTCCSEVIYIAPPAPDAPNLYENRWIEHITSAANRHVLPLFTSLLNVVMAYEPTSSIWSSDTRAPLAHVCLQLLIVCLDQHRLNRSPKRGTTDSQSDAGYADNFFINYLSRIHRDEDFDFMLKGFVKLLNNPLSSTYLPNGYKKIHCHQELLVLFWKCAEYNKKFLYHVLKTSDVLEILVPILYHLNDARNDQSRAGLVHMCVFIILLLSGERNFGVRLNKPYTMRVPMDIPIFSGNHADLLIIVCHKLITTGNQRLQTLFDCILTVIVNVSPYVKSLSMVAANKLVHLLEAFSTPWFLYSAPNNHHLVFFLLEVLNNIIQYQFDGNSNLIYTIIRKRQIFYQLANLPTDHQAIKKSLIKRHGKKDAIEKNGESVAKSPIQEGAQPALPAEPGTLTATLTETPAVNRMVEKATSSAVQYPMEEAMGVDRQRHQSPTREIADNVEWQSTQEWVNSWKSKLPLQTIMRMLQVLVPQVEKICIDKCLTDETEIIDFLKHGTLVGLLPVPHPILIRKYQANQGTNHWFRTYLWGVLYLRNTDPPIWYDTDVKLFELQRV